jgi:hypothetical protein
MPESGILNDDSKVIEKGPKLLKLAEKSTLRLLDREKLEELDEVLAKENSFKLFGEETPSSLVKEFLKYLDYEVSRKLAIRLMARAWPDQVEMLRVIAEESLIFVSDRREIAEVLSTTKDSKQTQ